MTTRNDTTGYDLSSTGTILDVEASGGAQAGWFLTATASADFAVEIRGRDMGWTELEPYTGVTSIDDGRVVPEATRIRIRNTSTTAAGETADAMLGVDN